ncbi:Uncharacterized protein containing a Zn-ribbon [Andreprevotia lacus DSM 23236]|jgi:predicted nucleic acid-binding Zn ribbon protein|uniref:Uncharacterized protein containing a Zn-ribbon n=1 Tax=Andreprevotia lacus DSM 23236 TaxID=1121001 RepID=A0A1W1XKC9_9NEIS|nr:DUF2116 family Zn-ribbon domain-containing protein [Andreprevotia lacus]SMC24277.1 Uncharacterized protein containing a Zn-ribbon [Andreprevotia lacus DSM 23236]
MSKAIDLSSDREQLERDQALARLRANAKRETPAPSGECSWCGDPTEPGQVFCCSECAKDWQEHNRRRQLAARIGGRA